MFTPAFERFVAAARRKPQLWRLLVGLVIVMAVYVGWFAAVIAVGFLVLSAVQPGFDPAALMEADTPLAVLVVLATFVGLAAGPIVAAAALHDRSARSVVGAPLRRPFLLAGAIAAGVFAANYLLLPMAFDPVSNTPWSVWLPLLPVAVVGLLIQTGAEEVAFRGYLQTQLAARFRSPWVWMVLPSVVFGLMHLDPAGQGPNAWWIVAATTLFGLAAADLTRVTGSIGAAWGFHFANNFAALLILGLDGALSGLARWTTPFGADDVETLRPLMVQDMLVTVIVWALIRLALAKPKRSVSG